MLMMKMHLLRRIAPRSACAALLLLLAAPWTAFAEAPSGVGLRIVEWPDPVSKNPMRAAVFFPSSQPTPTPTVIGPVSIAAQKDAPPREGPHPLVLLSHGHGGSMFGHHDTATFLAARGFVVAAIEHAGDNFKDRSGDGTDRVLVGRTEQLTSLLDFLAAHPAPGPEIDLEKVGVAGFSVGGHAALLLLGGQPDFKRLQAHCEQAPRSVLCAGGAAVKLSSPPRVAKADPRVRAAFLMNPAGVFFDRSGLAQVKAPVYLYAAAGDTVAPPEYNARHLRRNLPSPPLYAEVAGADHFVFMAPCTPAMRALATELCTDPAGVDREQVHQAMNGQALSFFEREIGRRSIGAEPATASPGTSAPPRSATPSHPPKPY